MARSARMPLFLTLLLLALLIAFALLGVRSCSQGKAGSETTAGPGGSSGTPARPGNERLSTPPNDAVSAGAESGRDARAAGTEGDGSRLTALTFVMDRSGLKVADVLTAPGRAKAPPTSVAPHQLEFTLQDAAGKVVYQGALDHPLRRVEEYEDPARPGEFKRLSRELDSEAFQLRFPAGLGARTVTLVERVTIDGQFRRTSLGTFPIP